MKYIKTLKAIYLFVFLNMKQKISSDFKLGILGGGQLGKMMIQAASKWDIEIHVLDPDESCSCSALCLSLIHI